jgi:hypothetical protein
MNDASAPIDAKLQKRSIKQNLSNFPTPSGGLGF